MSEQRWRANLRSGTVDEITIVNETDSFVDVQLHTGSWGRSIRREAKTTAYSEIHKTEIDAWRAIEGYAESRIESEEASIRHWRSHLTAARLKIGKLDAIETAEE